MSIALETQGVTKIYESAGVKVTAVADVSMQLREGEFISLVGPSGSGKTTLLAILAGLLRPTEGRVIIAGQDLSDMSEAELTTFRRQKIGFTFQENNTITFLTALENVELMLRLNGQLDQAGRQRAKDLLAKLGLENRLHNLPHQLSGGQQQRVAIARALIHNPAVVLADEPTASLDTELANQVVETFAQLIHETNRAGIMVTHDLRMCVYVDRVIQMLDGQIERILEDKSEIEKLSHAGHGQA